VLRGRSSKRHVKCHGADRSSVRPGRGTARGARLTLLGFDLDARTVGPLRVWTPARSGALQRALSHSSAGAVAFGFDESQLIWMAPTRWAVSVIHSVVMSNATHVSVIVPGFASVVESSGVSTWDESEPTLGQSARSL
jgi:hypothetical protein